MQKYANRANRHAGSSFRKIRKITTADFKTSCSLLLTGSFCVGHPAAASGVMIRLFL